MWNGTADTLKTKPIRSRTSPIAAMSGSAPETYCAPAMTRLVVPAEPYTSAMP